MRFFKTFIWPLIYLLLAYYVLFSLGDGHSYRLIFFSILLGFIIFNFWVRTSLSYKKYFTSPFNLLTTSIKSEKNYSVDKALMFDKVVEVLNDSEFNVVESDKENYAILATTPMTLKSWGENIYINFESKEDESIMQFCSSTFLQFVSWGKNEKNHNDLLAKIEDSFTI